MEEIAKEKYPFIWAVMRSYPVLLSFQLLHQSVPLEH